jgi:hypothetical protein
MKATGFGLVWINGQWYLGFADQQPPFDKWIMVEPELLHRLRDEIERKVAQP